MPTEKAPLRYFRALSAWYFCYGRSGINVALSENFPALFFRKKTFFPKYMAGKYEG